MNAAVPESRPTPVPGPPTGSAGDAAEPGGLRSWAVERGRSWWFTLLGAWVAGRVLVTVGVLLAERFVDRVDTAQPSVLALRWWAWDASWYDRLTGEGWAALGSEGYRFFPGYPLAAEPLAAVFGHRFALFAISWLGALVGIALAGELTRRATDDEALSRRVMLITGIFPAALALVSPASRGQNVIPAPLTRSLTTWVTMISRLSGWFSMASSNSGFIRDGK